MNEKQEWDGAERRAIPMPLPPSQPQWQLAEWDESMCPVAHTTVRPQDYDEVMRKLMADA